ncbi:MAG: rhodanese-like domain-containing protein [Cytophagales bacterium]|nr:rhodanese-like domain-containing protein [Cytophagales bacterium]
MKKTILLTSIVVASLSFIFWKSVPWTENQIIQPEALVKILNDPKAAKPVIINTGTMRNIKTAVKYGPVSDTKGMAQFKEEVAKLNKDKEVIIYCGCCKMDHCPNIEPAFNHLNSSGFKKIKLLYLKDDLVFDWVNKGYPMDAKQPF